MMPPSPRYITDRIAVDTDSLQLNAEWLFIICGKVSSFSGGTISQVISVVVADFKRAKKVRCDPSQFAALAHNMHDYIWTRL
jgi:hypothetical protein